MYILHSYRIGAFSKRTEGVRTCSRFFFLNSIQKILQIACYLGTIIVIRSIGGCEYYFTIIVNTCSISVTRNLMGLPAHLRQRIDSNSTIKILLFTMDIAMGIAGTHLVVISTRHGGSSADSISLTVFFQFESRRKLPINNFKFRGIRIGEINWENCISQTMLLAAVIRTAQGRQSINCDGACLGSWSTTIGSLYSI